MIVGIGTDLVELDRIEASVKKHGHKLAEKILSDSELKDYHMNLQPIQFLASRFAAKEAVAKALGTGFREGLYLRHIMLDHNELGEPQLRYQGKAAELAQARGVTKSFITISHEKHMALAFVVLEKA